MKYKFVLIAEDEKEINDVIEFIKHHNRMKKLHNGILE